MIIEYQAIESTSENWVRIERLASLSLDEEMLDLTQEKMLKNTLAMVALHQDEVIGYAAQTYYYETSKTAEVGSLIISRDYRGRGVGTELIRMLTTRVILSASAEGRELNNIIAFCNPQSAGLFQKLGFTFVSLTEVPSESLFACVDCPKHREASFDKCCNKTYVRSVNNGKLV